MNETTAPSRPDAVTDDPLRVLVTKIGLDGHDRGSRLVAAFLRDAGHEVIYTPPWQEIPAVVTLALQEDVDVIGISSLATDHLIVPDLMAALGEAGLDHVAVVVGGIVPEPEVPALDRLPVSARSSDPDRLVSEIVDRRGHVGERGPASTSSAQRRIRIMTMAQSKQTAPAQLTLARLRRRQGAALGRGL